jgi:SM-20-related protein
MSLLRLDALQEAPLTRDPFYYTVVGDFLAPADAASIRMDFPDIGHAGLLPVEATRPGPRFGALIQALRGRELAKAMSDKFDIDLVGRSVMITVRGRCAERDGRIHTDSECKLVTALLYLNERWEATGGRLRLLRRQDDLNDMLAEVPPDSGTLVAFRRSDRSWHGHEPFVGVRRYVMINWMATTFAAKRELFRHHLSAAAKRAFVPAASHA